MARVSWPSQREHQWDHAARLLDVLAHHPVDPNGTAEDFRDELIGEALESHALDFARAQLALLPPTYDSGLHRFEIELVDRTPASLDRLTTLLNQRGSLSGLVIDEHDDMPSSSAYRTRFGSLVRAYRLVGYSPGRDYDYVEINRVLRTMHPEVIAEAVAAIEKLGGTIRRDAATDLLDEATVKRLFVSEDLIELRAENKRYKPIVVAPDCELRILGKVVGVTQYSRGE